MKALLAAALLLAGGTAVPAQEPAGGGVLNLSCVEALVAADAGWLSGVFAFVAEKDSALAFADLVARNKAIRRKYAAKLMKDHEAAGGLTVWDHEVVMHLLAIYSSPMAQAADKLDPATQDRFNTLGLAPTMTLGEMNFRRKK
ncbi:MAG: hypothetical protein HY924_16585 [Elusimicrobia bacterium]|nr:hypothetical protein [Elusimicrobiota bacterium]